MEGTTISGRTKDHFDHVINDNVIYSLPDSPDRWPDAGNGGEEPDDPPRTIRVSTGKVFIATQPTVREHTVEGYVEDLKNGACMPPVAAIKCPEGYIVWNGHHRLTAHRLAGRKTIKLRIWAKIDKRVLEDC